ncbi:hypothetical protein [Brevundimonas sp. TWP2-3-2]|uniref:hypothetical protein n=1 Tax=unclassified Brevundimonas TaxID=2622653 RepID=UPI003CF2B779
MRRPIALVIFLSSIAACAPTEGPAPSSGIGTPDGGARQCFQPDRITNFTRGGTEQIYVKVLGGGVFAIQAGGCPDIGNANALVITPATGIGSQVCVGDSARIALPNVRFGPDQCFARIERSLTEAEVEALPGRQRP